MAEASPDKAELARRFAAECDAIALRGAAPDCAGRLAAINAAFDAELARRRAEDALRPASKERRAAS